MLIDNKIKFVYWRKTRIKAETGLSIATIYRLEKAGNFPSRYRLSSNIVAYRSDEVQAWMESRTLVKDEGK